MHRDHQSSSTAGCLGIRDGSMVSLKALPDVPEAIGVCVEPVSVDDWEVVERNADYMESQMLTQVHILASNDARRPLPCHHAYGSKYGYEVHVAVSVTSSYQSRP